MVVCEEECYTCCHAIAVTSRRLGLTINDGSKSKGRKTTNCGCERVDICYKPNRL